MDKLDVLKNSRLFGDLEVKELKKLVTIGQEHYYRAGEELFHQGDSADELLLIAHGSVRIAKGLSLQEEEEDVIRLGSGSYFGEMAAVEGNEDRPVSVYAIEKAAVLGFKSEKLAKLCDDDPELGYHVYRAITKAFARRIHRMVTDSAHYRTQALQH